MPGDDSTPWDWTTLKAEAHAALPLPKLFQTLGYSQEFRPGRWGKCPVCQKDGKFQLKEKTFKCYNPECKIHEAWDGPTLLAALNGLTEKAGFYEWLRLAGTLSQEDYDRLTQPKAGRKSRSKKKAGKTGNQQPDDAKIVSITEGAPVSDPVTEDDSENSDDGRKKAGAWHEFWEACELTAAHRGELMERRGFTRETIERNGFRTSRPANAKLIDGLRKRHGDDTLVELGLLRYDRARGYFAEPQLCGFGATGRKVNGELEFKAEVNPVLIPYFDVKGEVVTMRPHKGGLPKRLLPGDLDFTNFSHPYGEHLLANHRGTRYVVITEGEYKAVAGWQAGFPILAIPGVTFIANDGFRDELVALLRRHGIDEVVIIFDNEVKDDPSLPTYKPEGSGKPGDRYAVAIWSQVIALRLGAAGFKAEIGVLPDEWRERGKADFDSILRKAVHELAGGDFAAGTKLAAEAYQAAIDSARPPHSYVDDLFPSRARQLIANSVLRKTTPARLELGTYEHTRMAYWFRDLNPELAAVMGSLKGCYFVRKTGNRPKGQTELWEERRADAESELADCRRPPRRRQLRILIAFYDELLKGWPERISNFSLKGLYAVRSEETHEIEYYCRAWIPQERLAVHLRIPAKRLARLAEFRQFCLERLQSTFSGGERQLQALTEDLNTQCRFRMVDEVNSYGWHRDTGLYFFGDSAWAPDGTVIRPDEDLVFWHGDAGYQIDADRTRVGDGFQLGAPLMRPDEPDLPDLGERFRQFLADFRATVGDFDAWAILGVTFGYLAMPAFFREHGVQHPGLWLHGIYGEGKTQVVRWLMRIFGFPDVEGKEVRLTPDTTDVAIGRVMAQYSCLPVFLDEYKAQYATDARDGMLRGAFDRNAAAKGRIDNMVRTRSTIPRTTPIVCGESECVDSATRSRYVQSVISRRRRNDPGKAGFHRINQGAEHFWQWGRVLLRQRAEFSREFLAHYDLWTQFTAKLEGINDRAVVTYGVAFAGFIASAILLDGRIDAVGGQFRDYLLAYMQQNDRETRQSGNIERFWELFCSAMRNGVIKSDMVRKVRCRVHPDFPKRVAIVSRYDTEEGTFDVIAIRATDAFGALMEWLRRRGESFPLTQLNLATYLANEKYWAWHDRSERWKLRFGGKHQTAWGVRVDQFPWADEILPLIDEDDGTDGKAVTDTD